MSLRLAAGRSCPLFKLGAGEASPAPPGRGLCPLPTLLRGALPPEPPNGGKYPPYPPLTGRVRDRTGQAAFLPAARAGVAPQASRPLACRKGGKYHTAARRKYANARKRYTRPSVSERPKARRKVLCQAFFQESGGRGVLQGQGHQEKSSQGPAGQVGHHGVPHGPAPPALLQQQGKYSHFH